MCTFENAEEDLGTGVEGGIYSVENWSVVIDLEV